MSVSFLCSLEAFSWISIIIDNIALAACMFLVLISPVTRFLRSTLKFISPCGKKHLNAVSYLKQDIVYYTWYATFYPRILSLHSAPATALPTIPLLSTVTLFHPSQKHHHVCSLINITFSSLIYILVLHLIFLLHGRAFVVPCIYIHTFWKKLTLPHLS